MSTRYQRHGELREQPMGEETMVFDTRSDQVHVLNATSAFVWNCLAEPMKAGEIERRIREAFDTTEVTDVTALVQRALDQLEEKGLVERRSGES